MQEINDNRCEAFNRKEEVWIRNLFGFLVIFMSKK